MTLNSAMTTAVSALNAQSQALSAISNNLANSSTVGYKSVETQFKSLVTQAFSGTSYTGAGVTSSTRQNVSSQGSIESTSNSTDLALDGYGMFVVEDGSGGTYYTRAGAFDTDDEGYLVNGDYYLMGWPTDADGDLTVTQSSSTLQRINITDDVSEASATTKVSLDASLGSNSPATMVSKASSTTLSAANAADLSTSGIAAGDTFTVTTSDGVTTTITVADEDGDGAISLDDIAETINNTTGASLSATVTTDASGNMTLNISPTDDLGITSMSGAAATSLGLIDSTGALANTEETPTNYTTTMEVYDALGNLHTVTATWTHDSTDTSANTSTWTVSFASDDATGSVTSTLVFDGNGDIQSIDGSTTTDSLTLNLDWENGAADSALTIDMSSVSMTNSSTGVTQTYSADGYEAGQLSGTSISSDGTVYVSYDNGVSKAIYKIAVATFSNYDGLEALSNTIYQQSSTSGNVSLQLAGQGSAGTITSSALESSTTDTADEFTKMIVAQQAYSAASQVITTAKDMYDALISAVR